MQKDSSLGFEPRTFMLQGAVHSAGCHLAALVAYVETKFSLWHLMYTVKHLRVDWLENDSSPAPFKMQVKSQLKNIYNLKSRI